MRRYLIDYDRARPDGEFIALGRIQDQIPASTAKVDIALTVFLGLTDEEAAETLGIKLGSMQRMLRDARQFLFERTESPKCRKTKRRTMTLSSAW
jgi:DNA-directed RNA polymerase specialized sigma24 family protein